MAVVYATWVVIDVAVHGTAVPGYATLLMVVVALGGVQLITLGVIGEYVGRIYHEVKRRPPFVVQETDEYPSQGRTHQAAEHSRLLELFTQRHDSSLLS